MSLNDFHMKYLSQMIHERTGNQVRKDQFYLIESRLAPVLVELGFTTLADLADKLSKTPFGPTHHKVMQAMMNHESLFFRDTYPFELLKNKILPEIIKSMDTDRKLHIWSAACSSGQEPYSLAMLIKSDFPSVTKEANVRIHATDLSPEIIKRAEAGVYTEMETSRGLSLLMRSRFFDQVPEGWKIKSDVRRMIDFSVLNLLSPWPFIHKMDVIFVRHVLIYMDVETKKSLVERFISALKPGGFLFLGSSETLMGNPRLKFIDGDRAFCYQRV